MAPAEVKPSSGEKPYRSSSNLELRHSHLTLARNCLLPVESRGARKHLVVLVVPLMPTPFEEISEPILRENLHSRLK